MPIAPRLKGKTALVTGASRGIGKAVALRFAAEGASVAISHLRDGDSAAATLREMDAASAAHGHKATHLAFDSDAGDPAAIAALVADTVRGFGRLDILVNNAGFQLPTPGDSFDAATFHAILAVDLAGPALACRAALAHFLSRPGGGIIINTTRAHETIPKPGYLA